MFDKEEETRRIFEKEEEAKRICEKEEEAKRIFGIEEEAKRIFEEQAEANRRFEKEEEAKRRLAIIVRGYRSRMQEQKGQQQRQGSLPVICLDGIKQSQSIVQTGRDRNRNLVVVEY